MVGSKLNCCIHPAADRIKQPLVAPLVLADEEGFEVSKCENFALARDVRPSQHLILAHWICPLSFDLKQRTLTGAGAESRPRPPTISPEHLREYKSIGSLAFFQTGHASDQVRPF